MKELFVGTVLMKSHPQNHKSEFPAQGSLGSLAHLETLVSVMTQTQNPTKAGRLINETVTGFPQPGH